MYGLGLMTSRMSLPWTSMAQTQMIRLGIGIASLVVGLSESLVKDE